MRSSLAWLSAPLLGLLWLGGCSSSSSDTAGATSSTATTTTTSSSSSTTTTGSTTSTTTTTSTDASTSTMEVTTGSVVFGVTNTLQIGTSLDHLHVVVSRDGTTVIDRTLTQDGADDELLAFPLELSVDGEDGALVEASLEAYAPGQDTPVVQRLASTHIVKQKNLLLRVELQIECVVAGGAGVTCDAPLTCIDGSCLDPTVDPAVLEDYAADWSSHYADSCKPANHGAPEVLVGLGQQQYTAASDYDVAQVEAGPQGGHHIWIAIAQKNLRRKGSVTQIDGYVPDLDFHVEPFKVIFTMNLAADGYCDLSGLRFQLDISKDINELLGKQIQVTVTIKDADGDQAVGERWLTLSDAFIGP